MTNNLPKIYQNRQNMTYVRADVLNPMMFINSNVLNTKESLYIFDVLVVLVGCHTFRS